MLSSWGFILKIAIASLLLSELIKYGGRLLPISPTNSLALVIVLLPSLVLAVIFGWKYQQSTQKPL